MKVTHLLIWIVAVILLQSCNNNRNNQKNVALQNDTFPSFIQVDYAVDSVFTILDIADTVMYYKLNRPRHQKDVFQIFYDEKQILAYDLDSLFFYSLNGEEKNRISCPCACVDYDIRNKRLHIYEFKKKWIRVFTPEGYLMKTIRMKTAEEGFYGQYFAVLDDTTYVLAKYNAIGNDGGLLFISSDGSLVNRIGLRETFEPAPSSYTYNIIWDYPIIRTDNMIGYYPSYGDTIYWLKGEKNEEMDPFFVETVLKKVPLKNRTEVSGCGLTEYFIQCRENEWVTPRFFINQRFVLAQYIFGRSSKDFPGYLLYDRKTDSSYIFKNRFSRSNLHFGIFNDYDGGLGFTPLNQCGDYLIMVGAGIAQGGWESLPKTLYTSGHETGDTIYSVVSDKFKDIEKKEHLSKFFATFDEEKQTMITILRLRK